MVEREESAHIGVISLKLADYVCVGKNVAGVLCELLVRSCQKADLKAGCGETPTQKGTCCCFDASLAWRDMGDQIDRERYLTSVSLFKFHRSRRPMPSTAAKSEGCTGDHITS